MTKRKFGFTFFRRFLSTPTKNKSALQRKGEPDVYSVSSHDEGMNWAIEKAQLTLHYFINCLETVSDLPRYFSAKVKISDGTNTEHIWLTDVEFDNDGNLFGKVGNIPSRLSNIYLNQKVGIERAMVTDWMIIEKGRLIGGYTIRAIRDRVTDKIELSRFDDDLDNIIIDEGEDYFLPNFETPEGAILCIEQAYDESDIGKIMSCKDFTVEAELMLLKNDMLDNFDDILRIKLIETVAETLRLSLVKEIQENGMPDFRNCKRAFPLREKLTESHWMITEIVYHPDGSKTKQRINTYRTRSGWKVLNPEE